MTNEFEFMQFPGVKGSDIHAQTPEQDREEITQLLKQGMEDWELKLWIEIAEEFHYNKPFHESVRSAIIQRLKEKGFTISKTLK